jgi:hypothetical protein
MVGRRWRPRDRLVIRTVAELLSPLVRKGDDVLCRINRPTMVLALNDNHQAAIPIPAGKVVDIEESVQDDRFVVVSVDGERFLAFASDLRKPTARPALARAVVAGRGAEAAG